MRSEPLLLSVRDAAALLGISVSSVWRHAKDGTLPPPFKIGGSTRFKLDELLAAVDGLQTSRKGRTSAPAIVARSEMTVRAKESAK